jgi:hypothetical protein
MANLENNSADTRTFVQFCASLTKRQWVDLHADIVAKIKRSPQCVYKWKTGVTFPSSVTERAKISEIINRKFNLATRHWTLFPDPQL